MGEHRCGLSGPRYVGDPVDVVTGEVRDIATDFSIAGSTHTFLWNRHYHGFRVDDDRGLGRGHRHILDWSVRADLDGLTLDGPEDPIAFPGLWTDGDRATRQGWQLERVSPAILRAHHGERPVHEFIRHGHDTTEARLHRLIRVDGGETTLDYHRLKNHHRLTAVHDSDGWSLYLVWDGGHLVAIHARGPFQDFTPIRYQYDIDARLRRGLDAYGHAFQWHYDKEHRVVRRTDRRGHAFLYGYDAHDRCTRTSGNDDVHATTLAYLPGRCETRVRHEAHEAQWIYRYDPSQRLREIIDPYGGKRQFIFEQTGRQSGETDGEGHTWTVVHDHFGAPTGKYDPFGHAYLDHTNPGDHYLEPLTHEFAESTMAQEFGGLGPPGIEPPAMTSIADVPQDLAPTLRAPHEVGVEHSTRDPQGLLLRMNLVREGIDRRFRHYVYDPNGNIHKYTDYDGSTWRYTFESWNTCICREGPLTDKVRVSYCKRPLLDTVEDPGGTTTKYEWDLCDRLAGVIRHGKVRERYVYDRASNLIEKRGGDDRAMVEYTRGPSGILHRRRTWDGIDEEFHRDAQGRILRASSTSPGNPTITVHLAHDRLGQRCLDMRDEGGVQHGFDDHQLDRTTLCISGNDDDEGRVFETRYAHPRTGVVEITDPTGAIHRVACVTPGVYICEFANGTTVASQYDTNGNCIAKASRGSTGQWHRRFLRSGEGDLLVREDSRHGRTRFEYDAGHRLTHVHYPDGRVDSYHHDIAGNLRGKPSRSGVGAGSSVTAGSSNEVVLRAGNRLHRVDDHIFEYDDRDHLSTQTSTQQSLRYRRDGLDRMRRIEVTHDHDREANVVVEAVYDALGRRVRKRVIGAAGVQRSTFFWDTDRLTAEIRPDGRLRIYIYAHLDALVPIVAIEYPDIDAEPSEGRVLILQTDHRGAVECVEDAAGETVWAATIQPYGDAIILVGDAFHQPLRLVGQYHDVETDLCGHRYRNWSPELGRFLESDPIGLAGGMNLYAWPGSPLCVSDPLGLAKRKPPECGGEQSKRPKHGGTEGLPDLDDILDRVASVFGTTPTKKNAKRLREAIDELNSQVAPHDDEGTIRKKLQKIRGQAQRLEQKKQKQEGSDEPSAEERKIQEQLSRKHNELDATKRSLEDSSLATGHSQAGEKPPGIRVQLDPDCDPGNTSTHQTDKVGVKKKKQKKAAEIEAEILALEKKLEQATRGRRTQRKNSDPDGTPGNNQAQNKQFRDATRGLSKDEKNEVHREISGQNRSFGEIEQLAQDMKTQQQAWQERKKGGD